MIKENKIIFLDDPIAILESTLEDSNCTFIPDSSSDECTKFIDYKLLYQNGIFSLELNSESK